MEVDPVSLPDSQVMGNVYDYMAYLAQEFPFLQPLQPAMPGETAWEMAGHHPTAGICIAVRCKLDHPCGMNRPDKETLNAYVTRHLREKQGRCLTGHEWTVMTRDSIRSRLGNIVPNSTTVLTRLTNAKDDLAPVIQAIRGLTATFVDRDEDLDTRDVVHVYGAGLTRPDVVMQDTMVDAGMDDDDNAVFDDWLNAPSKIGQWFSYEDQMDI